MVVESGFDFFRDLSAFKQHILMVNGIAVIALIIIGGVILLLNRQLIRAEKMIVSQAALSQMGQMAAIIAHEVRNPLAIIKATAERIKKKYGNAEKSEQQLFDYIPEEVDRLHQITSHYLQFAAPESLKGKAESIGNIVQSVCEGMSKEFQRKGVTFQSEISDDIKGMTIDSVQLRQILMNLLRNALEATSEGGTVGITVKEKSAESIVMVVSDTGCGLSKTALKKLFDPFYTTKSSGTGLGLFVVKRLVDNLEGTIVSESKINEGSRFTVTLPVRKNG
jgi:signal transduction histidine kinase